MFLFGPMIIMLDMRTAMLEVAEAARNSGRRMDGYEHPRLEPSFRQEAG